METQCLCKCSGLICNLKGLCTLSSFTHPHVIPNTFGFPLWNINYLKNKKPIKVSYKICIYETCRSNRNHNQTSANNSQASFVVLCWMQVCSTSLARLWTSARTQRCISNTSRPHARRAKSKKWSGSVGKATAMTLNMSRTFSRYCQDSWKWSIADRKKHIIFSSFSSVKTLSICFPHYISCFILFYWSVF